jgi:hypothetical protein
MKKHILVYNYELAGFDSAPQTERSAARTRHFRLINMLPPPPGRLIVIASRWDLRYMDIKNLRKVPIWGKIREPIQTR